MKKKKKRKKKSLVCWIVEGTARTLIIYKGARKPFGNIHPPEYHGAKKARITIEWL